MALELKTITWPAKYVSRGAKVVESPKRVLEILADSNIFKVEVQESYKQQSFAYLINDGIVESKSFEEKWSTQIVDGV